jgi:peptidase E
MTKRRQLFALGGGGFSATPGELRIDTFALKACGLDTPNICFLPTASGDSDAEIDAFYNAFGERSNTDVSHVQLFRRGRRDISKQIGAADILYVGGGNPANLLALWRLHGVDEMVCDAHRAGAMVVGVSAGAACLFDGYLTDSFGPPLRPLEDGLGLVEGTFCPHYGSRRRARYHEAVAAGFAAGYGVDSGAALHFVDGELDAVLSIDDGATAYRVHKTAQVEEETLLASFLEA